MATTHDETVQLVIAHYNEDLTWLTPVAESSLVYTKGPSPPAFPKQTQRLPNIGREGHTYLAHIIEKYDDLAPVTLFLQGRTDDHISLTLDEVIKLAAQTRPGQVTTYPWRELEAFDHWFGIPWEDYPSWEKWWPSNMAFRWAPKTPAQYWKDLLGYDTLPHSVAFQPGALFAVHRDTIRKHPKQVYEKFQEEFFLGEMADINPITGHYMERFWLPLWNPEEYACWDESQISKRERNEQGQLARGRWHRTPKDLKVDPRTIREYAEKLKAESLAAPEPTDADLELSPSTSGQTSADESGSDDA